MIGSTPTRPAAPATLSQVQQPGLDYSRYLALQAEAGSAIAPASEREEQCKKAKENLDAGAAVTVLGFAAMLGLVSLTEEVKHPGLTVSLVLSFITFLSGKALMLLSLNMLGREVLVSGRHRITAKCLVAACAGLSVLTLLSLLALLPCGVYQCIGLAVVITAVMLAAAGTHWCLRRRRGTDRGGVTARYDEEQQKDEGELDAASRTASCVTVSAFGGLVGALFAAPRISGVDAVDRAAYLAVMIFSLFVTSILGMFVVTASRITNDQRCSRGLLATATRLANALLLCSLACAAFAAAFVSWY